MCRTDAHLPGDGHGQGGGGHSADGGANLYLLLSHPLFSYPSLSFSLFHEYCSGGVADADLPGDGHGQGGGGHSAVD